MAETCRASKEKTANGLSKSEFSSVRKNGQSVISKALFSAIPSYWKTEFLTHQFFRYLDTSYNSAVRFFFFSSHIFFLFWICKQFYEYKLFTYFQNDFYYKLAVFSVRVFKSMFYLRLSTGRIDAVLLIYTMLTICLFENYRWKSMCLKSYVVIDAWKKYIAYTFFLSSFYSCLIKRSLFPT